MLPIIIGILFLFSQVHFGGALMPCPFYRQLKVQNPPLKGDDIYILQSLLNRSPWVSPKVNISGYYDTNTTAGIIGLQRAFSLTPNGIFEEQTANIILREYEDDHYTDEGTIPPGYKYKVYVPVYSNRSIENIATLYDSKMNVLHRFVTRTHGQNDKNGNAENQLCGSGSTPTGLSSFDLNSPEDDPKDFGPYPVNRAVTGLDGNAKIVISDIRDGILLHTGEWDNWNTSLPMPNSHGCIHAHPDDVKTIWQILVSIGVEVRPNTNGKLPYPYKPQGILSVEQLDDPEKKKK